MNHMWFGRQKQRGDDAERRAGTPKVNARIGDQRQARRTRLRTFVGLPLAFVALAGLAGVLVWKTGEALFWKNPRYTLRKLTIRIDGHAITPQHVREYTGLTEGVNIFAFNLNRRRAEFLRKTPIVRSMSIVRELPDAIKVDVAERITIAKLGRWPGLLGVDRDGWVFTLRTGGREVPVVTGPPQSALRPGMRVDQSVMIAIELVDACNRSPYAEVIKITSVDVSKKEHLELYLAEGERVKLAWDGMGTTNAVARRNLDRKIGQMAKALRASEERGRRLANLDLTFHDQYAPAQEF